MTVNTVRQAGFQKDRTVPVTVGEDGGAAFAAVPNTHFSTFEARLKTFRGWPHSAAIRPLATPSALSSQVCVPVFVLHMHM
jgi:hypothetical protein